MSQPKILVIDDEAGPRQSLRMILKDECEVVLTESPLEGLRLVEEFQPDLVFLDIKMHEMDGTEVLRRIKGINEEVEVAMITAWAGIESAQEAVRHGAIDYLTKPFGVDEVLGVVQRAMDRRESRREQTIVFEQLQQTTRSLSAQLRGMHNQAQSEDLSSVYEGLSAAHSSIETQIDGMARLRAIGEIAAEVAHDVDNLLGAILLRIEMLMLSLRQSPQPDPEMFEKFLQDILHATQDSTQALARISLVSHDPYEPSQQVQVNDLLREAVDLSASQSPRGGQEPVTLDLGELSLITGNTAALRTAFMNLLVNARHAVADGGEIAVHTRPEGEEVVVEVADTGIGMSPEVLKRVTQPFFSTKGNQGAGLGLSITRKVLARHHGSLDFASEEGRGTTVTVRLPVRQPELAGELAAPQSVPDIMVAEDDEKQLRMVEEFLTTSGFRVHATTSSPAALKYFERYLQESGQAPRVLITDLRMPDLCGTDLAARVKNLAPETRVILLSAYVDETPELDSGPPLDVVLRKPFRLQDLLAAVRGEQSAEGA